MGLQTVQSSTPRLSTVRLLVQSSCWRGSGHCHSCRSAPGSRGWASRATARRAPTCRASRTRPGEIRAAAAHRRGDRAGVGLRAVRVDLHQLQTPLAPAVGRERGVDLLLRIGRLRRAIAARRARDPPAGCVHHRRIAEAGPPALDRRRRADASPLAEIGVQAASVFGPVRWCQARWRARRRSGRSRPGRCSSRPAPSPASTARRRRRRRDPRDKDGAEQGGGSFIDRPYRTGPRAP